MIFAVNRSEGGHFELAWEIDPEYATCLSQVVRSGVEILAVRLVHRPQSLKVGDSLSLNLAPPASMLREVLAP